MEGQPHSNSSFRLASFVACIVTLGTWSVVGCSGPVRNGDAESDPISTQEALRADDPEPRFEPSAVGTPLPLEMQDRAGDLAREMAANQEGRKIASRAATAAAQKLMNELKYLEAEEKLNEAIRLDPDNAEARRMLDQVYFILGDRRGEIRDVAREEFQRERVRRQQAVVELERMYVDGRRQMDEGEYDDAIRTFDKLLERISWFPFNIDLTDLRTKTLNSKAEADVMAQERSREARRERELRVQEDAERERVKSLKFVENRIRELMRRANKAYDQKEFDEVLDLTDQVMELDQGDNSARRLNRRARRMRHAYQVLETSDRHKQEWERTFLGQLESEVPYQKIFNFPDEDQWNRITRKQISLSDRVTGTETAEDRNIRLKLRIPIDVEFPDQPFEEVIDFFQSVSGVNFVLTNEARQALEDADEPVRLAAVKGLPLENVLRLVLDARDPKFSYVLKNGAVIIGPAESLREDLYLEFYMVSDITKDPPDFPAPQLALSDEDEEGGGGGSIIDIGDDSETTSQSIQSDVLVELVENTLWGEDGAPEGESVDFQSGKLVVRSTLEQHQKVQMLLEALRKSTGIMVTVESRFLNLQDNFLESVGVNIGNPFNTNLPNPISDIDGQGTSIAPGYEWVDAQGQTNVRSAVFNAFSLPLGSAVSPFQLSDRGGFALQYNVLDNYILEALLEANAKTQEFKSLSAPRVTAFNTQISHSLVIDQSAYIRDAEVNQTGVIPVINPVIGILNAGSILQVRPTVSYDRKYVILEIEPTLAVQLPSRFKRLTLGLTNLDVEFPVLNVVKVKTTVTIPDGGTVLVGGLKQTILQKQRVGAPWVSRLPGLNLLFGRKGQARMQANLFVLIHAKITVIEEEERAEFN